jgi:hypothetical protein
LRIWLILSAIFFIIWGTIYPELSIQLDTLLFNLLFIIINVVQCIPLIKTVWPVKLTPLELEIYNRNFSSFMNRKQFKHLISHFEYDVYRAEGSQIISIDQNFKSVFYVAKIYEGYEVFIIGRHDLKVKQLCEGAWIGIIEYKDYEEKLKNYNPEVDDILWRISAVVHKASNVSGKGVVVYEFPIKKLNQLYSDKSFAEFYFKAIHAIWLDYGAQYLAVQDINLIDYMRYVADPAQCGVHNGVQAQ